MDEFRAGVTASLRSWSALKTAVQSGWGGSDSVQKAEDLRNSIFQHFDGSSVPPKSMADVTDLEDALAIYMEEEFSVVLEDGSEQQIADVIWRMYDSCSKGDLVLANQVVASAEQAAVALQSAFPQAPVVQSPEQDDDDDDGDNMDTSEAAEKQPIVPLVSNGTTSAADYAAQPLFEPARKLQQFQSTPRQLGEKEAPTIHEKAVVDEDGFAPVQKRKSRKAT